MDFLAYIFLAGALAFLPSLFWLWFWLKEDDHPEPRREILLVFLAGMLGVVVAIILENSFSSANNVFQKFFGYGAFWFSILNIFGFAFLEEITKTAAAFFTAIRSKYFDEPVDAMIYMVAAALGFAALANILFLVFSFFFFFFFFFFLKKKKVCGGIKIFFIFFFFFLGAPPFPLFFI